MRKKQQYKFAHFWKALLYPWQFLMNASKDVVALAHYCKAQGLHEVHHKGK